MEIQRRQVYHEKMIQPADPQCCGGRGQVKRGENVRVQKKTQDADACKQLMDPPAETPTHGQSGKSKKGKHR
jgi:hypothetical protein